MQVGHKKLHCVPMGAPMLDETLPALLRPRHTDPAHFQSSDIQVSYVVEVYFEDSAAGGCWGGKGGAWWVRGLPRSKAARRPVVCICTWLTWSGAFKAWRLIRICTG